MRDQENIPPEKNAHQTTPPKGNEGSRDVLRESQMTVPETPSPDQPNDMAGKKEHRSGNGMEIGPRKRQSRMNGISKTVDLLRVHNGGVFSFGSGDNNGLKSGSAYTEICLLAAQHFARIREVLVERSVSSTLNSVFLTPW